MIAILIHDMFEDWLDAVGLSLESFCTEATGSWWFNYAQALRTAGVATVLIATSSRITVPVRFVHKPTGAPFWVLPTPFLATAIRRWLVHPVRTRHDRDSLGGKLSWARSAVGRHLASHVSTPRGSLATTLRREQVRSLLVEEYEYPRFDTAVLLGRSLKIPVFGTFCGALPQSSWRRPLRLIAMRLCAGLAVCARSEMDRVARRYGLPSAKVQWIQYPIDRAIWHPDDKRQARQCLGIPPNAEVVAYHGAISLWTKGIEILLDAWEALCWDRPDRDMRLILVGSGVDAEEFARILAARRPRGVHWVNRWEADRALIRQHLVAADVYVFPSRGDACPVSIAEALACGLPVVSTRIRGIPDIVPEGELSGGILVDAGQVDQLKQALARVLDDPGLAQRLRSAAIRNATERFSMETIGSRLRALLLPEWSPGRN